jgi:hypothetical protein
MNQDSDTGKAMHRRSRWPATALIALILAAGCSSNGSGQDRSGHRAASSGVDAPVAASAASDFRLKLNSLFAEHVALAAGATGAALGGRQPEFTAAAEALDANSVDLSKLLGSVYGAEAEKAFLPGWRRHIGFFVEYTTGAAAKDSARQEQAIAGLDQYARELAGFLYAACGLPQDAVVSLVREHVTALTAVIDAQAAGDHAAAYRQLRVSMAHMHMLADPLAEATAKRFPAKFGG